MLSVLHLSCVLSMGTSLRWYDGVTNDTLTGIYSAVLYRYASTGDAAPGFHMLGSAFLPKK